jgi:hypothetical protein
VNATVSADLEKRLPPRQQLAAPGKWPMVGEKLPRASDAPWTVTIAGLVAHPRTWSLAELEALPREERRIDIHCVTRWTMLDARFGGFPLKKLLEQVEPLPTARFLSFVARSERNHSTSLPLQTALELGAWIALTWEGRPLETSHGGPVRVIVPGRYFYKSIKWLERIELLAEDRLGYWEGETGYHNEADPWKEQRYLADQLDRRMVLEIVAKRDFSGRALLNLHAAGIDLEGLNACGALLRNADFRRANLMGACFDGANLSNASLESADLRKATFVVHQGMAADVEGAIFQGSDLRGADFRGASLFGATFCSETGDSGSDGACIDASTQFDEAGLEQLTPRQRAYVEGALKV